MAIAHKDLSIGDLVEIRSQWSQVAMCHMPRVIGVNHVGVLNSEVPALIIAKHDCTTPVSEYFKFCFVLSIDGQLGWVNTDYLVNLTLSE